MDRQILRYLQSPLSLSLKQLKQIHALITVNGSSLISNFTKRLLNLWFTDYARKVFDDIPQPDKVLCSSFIARYTKLSLNRQALDMFVMMHRRRLRMDSYTISPAIRSCTALTAVEIGKQIHSLAIHYGVEWNHFVQIAMMDFYAKSGDPDSAKAIFDFASVKDAVSYNILIFGYSKCGESLTARKLFDEMTERDIISWNSIISCYARNGDLEEAMKIFERMQAENHPPDEFTLGTLLSACAKSGNLEMGMKIKAFVEENSWFSDVIVASALIEMFVKCGEVDQARGEFDRMKERDIVTWGTMITGYAQNSRPDDALDLFEEVKRNGIKPSKVVVVSVLSACAQLGSLKTGEPLENYIEMEGFGSNPYIASALVNMYSRCGQIHKARRVFQKAAEKNLDSVALWTSMIAGLAFNGCATEAIALFGDLERSGVEPNDVTFVAVLSACTHAGLVDLGLAFFESMRSSYKLVPKIEHYVCIVDLFGRCGRLNEAYEFIRKMEIEPDSAIWLALLSSCRTHSNIELAEVAVERLMVLVPEDSGNYVLLSNLYVNSGRWQDALRMRRLARDTGIQSRAACSWIELEDGFHTFLVSDTYHPRSDEIYNAVDVLAVHSISDKIDVRL